MLRLVARVVVQRRSASSKNANDQTGAVTMSALPAECRAVLNAQ